MAKWLALAAGCALLLAGAVGNLIDRVRFGGLVIDSMNLGVGPLPLGGPLPFGGPAAEQDAQNAPQSG